MKKSKSKVPLAVQEENPRKKEKLPLAGTKQKNIRRKPGNDSLTREFREIIGHGQWWWAELAWTGQLQKKLRD